jgi:hypothetical protein
MARCGDLFQASKYVWDIYFLRCYIYLSVQSFVSHWNHALSIKHNVVELAL